MIEYKGRVVPWITRWTGEVPTMKLKLQLDFQAQRIRLSYDGNDERDERGILWQREGINRSGEPQWSQVSTPRQVASMRKRLCQVCGNKIITPVIPWLVPKIALYDGEITMSAPTCEECIPLALSLCPHLKTNEHVIANVLEYEPWGMYGGAVILKEDGSHEKLEGITLPYEAELGKAVAVLGQQEIVRFTKFTLKEV